MLRGFQGQYITDILKALNPKTQKTIQGLNQIVDLENCYTPVHYNSYDFMQYQFEKHVWKSHSYCIKSIPEQF